MSIESGLHQLLERFGRSYQTGDVICAEGEPGREIFFLVRGTVTVTTSPKLGSTEQHSGETRELTTLGPGDVFGEVALLDELPRSATVSALEEVQAIVFNEKNLYTHIGLYPELAVRLLKLLAQRMRRMDSTMKELMGHQDYLDLIQAKQNSED